MLAHLFPMYGCEKNDLSGDGRSKHWRIKLVQPKSISADGNVISLFLGHISAASSAEFLAKVLRNSDSSLKINQLLSHLLPERNRLLTLPSMILRFLPCSILSGGRNIFSNLPISFVAVLVCMLLLAFQARAKQHWLSR